MDLEKIKKDRDAYLAKLKKEHPLAFNFYDNEANFVNKNAPLYTIKETSKKPITSLSPNAWTKESLIHLLKRTRVGARAEEIDYFEGKTMEEVVDELLQPVGLTLPINDYAIDGFVDSDAELGEPIHNLPYNNAVEGERITATKSWMISHLLHDEKSIHPIMWLFWMNHFVIEMWGVFNAAFNYRFIKKLHDLALGDFKEMTTQVTLDQAMLIYLNGTYNVKYAPDENYARELQELFCIGKGPNSNYKESDVQAAARVLTGWKTNWDGQESWFYADDHDTDDKQFSEFYGNKVIQGQSGEDGKNETFELIDMIFENDETAAFICRKLYTFFVYAVVDDWAEENVIQPLAQTFRDNDYNITPVLKQLLTSEHFYDEVHRGAIIKSPVDILLGFWKTCGVDYTVPEEDFVERGFMHKSMLWNMSEWGQQVGDPPDVAGWPAYYQVPGFDKSWVTTNTITRRISYTDVLIYWGFWSQFAVANFDVLQYTASLSDPADPNALLADISAQHLGIPLADSLFTSLKSILLSGQDQDYYWSNAWTAYTSDPDNEELKNIVLIRLSYMYQKFFQLAEFQLK